MPRVPYLLRDTAPVAREEAKEAERASFAGEPSAPSDGVTGAPSLLLEGVRVVDLSGSGPGRTPRCTSARSEPT